MNAELVAILAHIAACQARVAGMQAANQQRAAVGESVRYDEGNFNSEAFALEHLAAAARSAQ